MNWSRVRRRFLEFLIVILGSVLVGLVIGILQHYVGLGVWGAGFSRDAFYLACLRETAIIVAGSLIGGCGLGMTLYWLSALFTPILTIILAAVISARRSHTGG